MKLGVVSRIGEFPEKDWKHEFRVFGKEGKKASHLELIFNYPHLGPLDYKKEQGSLLKQYAKEYDLELTAHLLPNQRGLSKRLSRDMFSDPKATREFTEHEKKLSEVFNIGSLDETIRKRSATEVIMALRMAAGMGVKLVTIHGGYYNSTFKFQEHLAQSRKTVEELNPYFENEGIKLCVENLPLISHAGDDIHEYPKTINGLLGLIHNLENVGACLDVGHANTSPDQVLPFYNALMASGKLWDMHLHDNKGKKDDHLVMGEGTVPFYELFRRLCSDSYPGYLSVELDTWCTNGMEKHERVYGLGYLRGIIQQTI